MRAAALLLFVGGCDQLFDLDRVRDPDPEAEIDAAVGQLIDASLSCPNGTLHGHYGQNQTGLFEVCIPSNAGPVALGGTIDTTDAAVCDLVTKVDTVGTEVCVKWASVMAVSSLRATGTRALVLAAAGSLSVSGTIDVSSKRTGTRGAGGSFTCSKGNGPSGSGGGAGGAGGSFGSFGGGGGSNASGQFVGARALAMPDRVRGGCEGGTGGAGPVGTAGGAGGKSGGAIYFIAGGELNFTNGAIVNASGAGGRGGTQSMVVSFEGGGGGGGGGGSGGLIGLDAPVISIGTAKFFANGGGGGGGSSVSTAGSDGADPIDTAAQTQANGGAGTAYSGRGGNGAAKASNGAAGASSKAGGGGGGGLGHIVMFTTNVLANSGIFSPAAAQP